MSLDAMSEVADVNVF